MAEPTGSQPGPPHAARTTHASEDSSHQRSNQRTCCLRDVICNNAVPFVFRVNLAQIHSAVPAHAIHCQIQVPKIECVSLISPIWCINGRQTIIVNSGVSGPKFTKQLYDVGRTSVLLTSPPLFHTAIRCGMRVLRRKACRQFRSISYLKLVAMAMSLDRSETNTRLNIYTNMSTIPENLAKIGLVVSEISLLQAIVKRQKRKESNSSIT